MYAPLPTEEAPPAIITDAAGPGSSGALQKSKRPLTLLPLIAILFYEVSGGPFGTEVR